MRKVNPALRKRVSFSGTSQNHLAATLDLPPRAPIAYALLIHCFTCKTDSSTAARISRRLTEKGIAVLRFDFTGLGGSEGDIANANFASNTGDVLKAIEFMRTNYQAPQLLIGHSLGAIAAILLTKAVPEVKLLATIAAPSDLDEIKKMVGYRWPEMELYGEVEMQLADSIFRVREQFITAMQALPPLAVIDQFEQALLVHSITLQSDTNFL